MTKTIEKALFTLFLFAVVTVSLFLTLRLGQVARLVPLAVIVPTLALLAFQLLLDIMPHLRQQFSSLENKDLFHVRRLREKSLHPNNSTETTAAMADEEQGLRRNEMITMLWILLLPVFIYLFGFLLALPWHTFCYLRWRSGESWLMASGVASGVFALVYSVFVLTLRMALYEGELSRWLGL